MANIILIRAVAGASKSRPIKIYRTDDSVELPKQFVLRIDQSVNRDGEDQLTISNGNIGLISSHSPEWLTTALTGFRKDYKDATFIVAERYTDNIPTTKALANEEAY